MKHNIEDRYRKRLQQHQLYAHNYVQQLLSVIAAATAAAAWCALLMLQPLFIPDTMHSFQLTITCFCRVPGLFSFLRRRYPQICRPTEKRQEGMPFSDKDSTDNLYIGENRAHNST
jgi:hypothetical protein